MIIITHSKLSYYVHGKGVTSSSSASTASNFGVESPSAVARVFRNERLGRVMPRGNILHPLQKCVVQTTTTTHTYTETKISWNDFDEDLCGIRQSAL